MKKYLVISIMCFLIGAFFNSVHAQLVNSGFETWTAGKPDGWFGTKTNIALASISQYTSSVHGGASAVKLVNQTTTHKRFTTQPLSVVSGVVYTVSFWVRGHGNIRVGLFDNRAGASFGYAVYSLYSNINSSAWTQVSYNDTAATTNAAAEFILSVQSTLADLEDIQVDDVTIISQGTSGNLPAASTIAVTDLTTTSATLNGMVNPSNFTTSVSFEYGLTSAYGNTLTATPNNITGLSDVAVSAPVSGLVPNTIYHYRVIASNLNGTSNGSDQAFLTLGGADTITVMQYNLLNYGNMEFDCTAISNDPVAKDAYLNSIINHVKPDIFTCNEMSVNIAYQTELLDSALNKGGQNSYQKVTLPYSGNALIQNMLYYNTNKFVYHSNKYITTSPRMTNIVKLYYKSSDLAVTHDTAFINCIITHLHSTDTMQRRTATQSIMTQITGYGDPSGNYLLMGDLNTKGASEPCYQNLVNWSVVNARFFDPINQLGEWNSNYIYKNYHTQSTRNGTTVCFASGGLDDRFDFIMASGNIISGSNHFKYMQSSYAAIGQDGQHMNKNINEAPANNSVPSNVLNALYNMSDHLPVKLKLIIDKSSPVFVSENKFSESFAVSFANPVSDNLKLGIESGDIRKFTIEIISIYGQVLFSTKQDIEKYAEIDVPVHQLGKGIYFVKISNSEKVIVKKFMKI